MSREEFRQEFGADFAHHYRHLPLTLWQRTKLRAVTGLIVALAATTAGGGAFFASTAGILLLVGIGLVARRARMES